MLSPWLWFMIGPFGLGLGDVDFQPSAPMQSAHFVIHVPAGVEVWFDNEITQSTGAVRHFHSPPLPFGSAFAYTIRLRAQDRWLAQKRVTFHAGETVTLRFDVDERATPSTDTTTPPSGAASAAKDVNFGIDLQSWSPGFVTSDRYQFNGEPIQPEQARLLLQNPLRLPDQSTLRRLTVIGNREEQQQAAQLLQGELQPLVQDYIVKMYQPTDWAVARAGFKTDGHPMIYAQEPDGTVLFRQEGLTGLAVNLKAIRQPRPDYQPDKDPDYRQSSSDVWIIALAGLTTIVLLYLAWRPDPLV